MLRMVDGLVHVEWWTAVREPRDLGVSPPYPRPARKYTVFLMERLSVDNMLRPPWWLRRVGVQSYFPLVEIECMDVHCGPSCHRSS